MPAAPFLTTTALGCIPWKLALAYAGLQLGGHYYLVERSLGAFVPVVAVAVVVLLAIAYVVGRCIGGRSPEPERPAERTSTPR
jgi:membrane protein DedA with SNARE-associated domain